MNDSTNKTWGTIIRQINAVLQPNHSVSIASIATLSGLTESEVRNFLPFTNTQELIKNGETVYRLNSMPKKMKNRQKILLVLKAEKLLYDNAWLTVYQIRERLQQAFTLSRKEADKITQQLSQVYATGHIDRKGMRPNYLYTIVDNPVARPVVAGSKASYATQLLEIAAYVEKAEVRIAELEAENVKLQKKVVAYERHAQAVVDNLRES